MSETTRPQVGTIGWTDLTVPNGRYCVIQDPAGAVAALIAPPREEEG